MFKRLWIILREDDYHAQSHRRGMIILLFLIGLIFSTPLLWSNFIPQYSFEQNEEDITQLKEDYQLFLDSIDCAKQENRQHKFYEKKEKHFSPYVSKKKKAQKVISKFNLNQATKEKLIQVRGIGDYYAQRIIKFRDKLGGFYEKEQLYQVYGLDSSVVKETFKHLDQSELVVARKINVNVDSFKVVLKHPYLEYKDVQKVFNNRPISEKNLCKVLPTKCEKLQAYLIY